MPQLRVLCTAIARVEAEIERLCESLPDHKRFASLPGAGPVFAARLLAAFGEQRDRFPDAAALQKLAGYRAGHRAQRKQVLGSTGVGRAPSSSASPSSSGPPRQLRDPSGLARSTTAIAPKAPPTTPRSRPGLQVDPHPLPMLGRPHALRRVSLPSRPPEAPFPAPQVRRPAPFLITLRSASGRGLDGTFIARWRTRNITLPPNRTARPSRRARGALSHADPVPRSECRKDLVSETLEARDGVQLSREAGASRSRSTPPPRRLRVRSARGVHTPCSGCRRRTSRRARWRGVFGVCSYPSNDLALSCGRPTEP